MTRVNHAVNQYIDAHASLSPLKPVVLYLRTSPWLHPVSVGVLILVGCLLALIIHAYWETRTNKEKGHEDDLALPARMRRFSKELAEYLSNISPRPDENEIWQKYGSSSSPTSSGQLFVEKYNETVQLWDDALVAGYWNKFKNRAVHLRNELAEMKIIDRELDNALMELDKPATDETYRAMRKLIERFRYQSSLLD